MRVATRPNRTLRSYLQRDPVLNLFPLYIGDVAPDARSLVASRDGAIRGALVNGADSLSFASSSWLVADDDVASPLIEAAAARSPGIAFNYARRHAPCVATSFPERSLRVDRFYVYDAAAGGTRPLPVGLEVVAGEDLASRKLSDEMKRVVGSPATLPRDRFWGLCDGDTLVATADGIVESGSVAAVQRARRRHDRFALWRVARVDDVPARAAVARRGAQEARAAVRANSPRGLQAHRAAECP